MISIPMRVPSSSPNDVGAGSWRAELDRRIAQFGDWLSRHQAAIRRLQWGIVLSYAILVIVPALRPLPAGTAHLWSDLTLFAQFVFWGIWWPFVLLSMILVGRAWCGFLCPEGALTEIASRRSLGRHLPRWLTWGGWPFVAFALTTVYGQMVSVYQYPKPALLILGGSTAAAVGVGLVFGRNKRVWCRYLCPVNGVFALLAKLAPLNFRVDPVAWTASQRTQHGPSPSFNCAPLVPVRTMQGTAACHMCGRCSGFRGAVTLARRSPNHEIVHVAGNDATRWESLLIVFGLIGLGMGAFHWTVSPWFISLKQSAAEWLVAHDVTWPLEALAPWWLLTNYPAQNDVMTLLDGATLLVYISLTALVVGGAITALLVVAAAMARGSASRRPFDHLAQGLIPLAGCGVFLGLSALSVTMLRQEGLRLAGVGEVRMALLAGASLWSLWLAWRITGLTSRRLRRVCAVLAVAAAISVADLGWALLFWVW
jgi:polyferredoxin